MEVIDIKDNEVFELVKWVDSQCVDCDTVFNIGRNATLSYVEVVCSKSVKTSKIVFNCKQDCKVFVNTLDIDNKELKREQVYNLDQKGIEVDLVGLYLVGKGETCDNVIKVNHNSSDCSSKQLYKGVVDNVASFNGHIYIAKDAQRSVALQQNHNLLLSDSAKAQTKPWLEIYADDVKCNHGATCGKNDDQALFYMQQRGISLVEAKKLLMQGYVKQCVNQSKYREKILELIENKINTL